VRGNCGDLPCGRTSGCRSPPSSFSHMRAQPRVVLWMGCLKYFCGGSRCAKFIERFFGRKKTGGVGGFGLRGMIARAKAGRCCLVGNKSDSVLAGEDKSVEIREENVCAFDVLAGDVYDGVLLLYRSLAVIRHHGMRLIVIPWFPFSATRDIDSELTITMHSCKLGGPRHMLQLGPRLYSRFAPVCAGQHIRQVRWSTSVQGKGASHWRWTGCQQCWGSYGTCFCLSLTTSVDCGQGI